MYIRPNGTKRFKRLVTGLECAQCGEYLIAPDWSEYIHERRVRHLWKCEPCDYSFETTVSFPTAAA